jgi:hypothetical protein
MTVSEKLQLLQETYMNGKEFGLILDKLLDSTLSEYRLRLARYNQELEQFEQRFGIASAQLYQQFQQGDAGDAIEYFEWTGVYELKRDLLQKIQKLETVQ